MFAFFRKLALSLLFVSPLASAAEIHERLLPDRIERSGVVYSLTGCGLREFFFIDIYLLGI